MFQSSGRMSSRPYVRSVRDVREVGAEYVTYVGSLVRDVGDVRIGNVRGSGRTCVTYVCRHVRVLYVTKSTGDIGKMGF